MIYNVRQYLTDCYTIVADHPIKFQSVKHLKIPFRHIQTSSAYKALDQQCFKSRRTLTAQERDEWRDVC
jgi:formyltetrahydrofolate hydrolase